MSSTKRASTVPKPPTDLSSSAIVSESAFLIGKKLITIREHTVVHPRATLSSAYSHITIGSTCIIGERSSIGLKSSSIDQPEGVVIEDAVVVEATATIEARRVGSGSTIEIGAVLGRGSVIGKHCKIGPLCRVEEGEVLPDHTVLYGGGMRRVDTSGFSGIRTKLITRQVEVLRKLVPGNLGKWQ